MKLYVLPYQQWSNSAKRISRELRARRIKLFRSRFRPKPTRLVINWGNSNPPFVGYDNMLNKPDSVVLATNKLLAFEVLQANEVRVPKWTTDIDEAIKWFDKPDTVVFCRTLLRSSSGKGIVIAKTPLDLVKAPLYTRRVRKTDEYRVHVFNNVVIDVAHKRLRNGLANEANRNAFVRNIDNGWIHAHENVNCPQEAKDLAVKAVAALGLHFGAVDIGVTKSGLPFVFEVNTAPGLENKQTIGAYITAINNYKKEEEQKHANAQRNKNQIQWFQQPNFRGY